MKKIEENCRKFNCNMVPKAIEENKNLEIAKGNLMLGRKRILVLKTKSGKITRNQQQILKKTANF